MLLVVAEAADKEDKEEIRKQLEQCVDPKRLFITTHFLDDFDTASREELLELQTEIAEALAALD